MARYVEDLHMRFLGKSVRAGSGMGGVAEGLCVKRGGGGGGGAGEGGGEDSAIEGWSTFDQDEAII